MSAPERRAMVDRDKDDLSVRRQCELLDLPRSGVYRPKSATPADDLALMRRIDELHLELPFYGSRRMMFALNAEGQKVNRKRVQRLMRLMDIEALAPRPGTSKAAPGNKIYPYLLRGVAITEPNHVWATDITYIPMAHGFLYLVAVMDWASLPVKASLVNCAPWSVLKIFGLPYLSRASSSASRQNRVSIVLESRHDNTARLAQSITATRYRKPCAIGM